MGHLHVTALRGTETPTRKPASAPGLRHDRAHTRYPDPAAAFAPAPAPAPAPAAIRPSRRTVLGAGLTAGLGATALAGSGSGSGDNESIVVAIVSNPQMCRTRSASSTTSPRSTPTSTCSFVSLPENEARAKITASVASGGGEFDVVMISNYETPLWAPNGWLTDLEPYIAKTDGYAA